MIRRTGVTLVEVLVAIFIMGIGMIALLTLFPLGALTMAQAIKDDRTGHAANNATAIFKLWNIGHNSTYYTGAPSTQYVTPIAPLTLPPIPGGGPSYPLYIDPIGVIALGGPPTTPVGNIARVSPTLVTASANPAATARRWFSFLDDIAFPDNGVLTDGFDREGRYSWAYLCRMSTANDFAPATSQIDLTVVVYSGRSLQLSATLSSVSETAYGTTSATEPGPVTFIGPNRIQIQWAVTKPRVRKGGWILDDRMPAGNPQGYFYRVVNTTDVAANVVELELQTDLRGPAGVGSVVVLDNVVEVFERGPYVPGN